MLIWRMIATLPGGDIIGKSKADFHCGAEDTVWVVVSIVMLLVASAVAVVERCCILGAHRAELMSSRRINLAYLDRQSM